MSKWYGSVNNRMEEGRNYTGREIRVGDDITMYLWSDRHCYYVTEVIDQKCIKVREYYPCADHSTPGGAGHQDWLYFKTWDEWNEYLAQFSTKYHHSGDHRDEPDPETWVYRYNKWVKESVHTEMPRPEFCTKREREHFTKHGYYKTYSDLSGKVSFGIRDYYHDWEF